MLLTHTLKQPYGKEVNWIHLAHDTALWRAYMNTIMNRCVTCKAGNFRTEHMSNEYMPVEKYEPQ